MNDEDLEERAVVLVGACEVREDLSSCRLRTAADGGAAVVGSRQNKSARPAIRGRLARMVKVAMRLKRSKRGMDGDCHQVSDVDYDMGWCYEVVEGRKMESRC